MHFTVLPCALIRRFRVLTGLFFLFKGLSSASVRVLIVRVFICLFCAELGLFCVLIHLVCMLIRRFHVFKGPHPLHECVFIVCVYTGLLRAVLSLFRMFVRPFCMFIRLFCMFLRLLEYIYVLITSE